MSGAKFVGKQSSMFFLQVKLKMMEDSLCTEMIDQSRSRAYPG